MNGPLGRPRHGWKDDLKLEIKLIWWEFLDWINLAQDKD
jgi:hypothetical protein